MNILDELTKRISAAFEASGYAPEYGRAAVSNRPDLCDYQCNGALTAAKQYRKSPLQIAGEVSEKLKGDEVFESVEVVHPGFINICIACETLSRIMQEMLADERLLLPQMERRT
ncbi:MAG: arginine--tRNA ligase, partial [Oscillospiraceae bacterium]